MQPNFFEVAAAWRGSITSKQELALNRYASQLGRVKFAEYRRRARVGSTPITRLSSRQASDLIQVIKQDLEGADDER